MTWEKPESTDSHYPFWRHIKQGGTVRFKNSLTDEPAKDLTLAVLGGDAKEIYTYGYMDLVIIPSDGGQPA